MGKKTKNKQDKVVLPFVSVCTPTFNRRPFWDMCIENFKNQDYPMDRMEWIIIDDGTDLIEDLVKDIPQVKYFKYDTKMSLGKKRNLMHDKSCGDIIVYMDDDDYYPNERVSHAVNMLVSHPNALCAGASEIYIWFKHIQQMWQFGPYNANHATAGTFAFKRELLNQHRYEIILCLSSNLNQKKQFWYFPIVRIHLIKKNYLKMVSPNIKKLARAQSTSLYRLQL
jgi:glycosyltransferase involved in cell wall biosynthesis